METSRLIGIGIVMIIPSFVGAGAMWDLFGNWVSVTAWIVLIAIIYAGILYRGISSKD